MTKTTQRLTGADFRALRHCIKQVRGGNYSAPRFAGDLEISESMLQLVETDRREITPRLAKGYRRVERDLIFCIKEADTLEQETVEWLVTALERHQETIEPRQRRRLRKLTEAK